MKTNTFPVVLDDTFMLSPSVKHFSFISKQDFNYIPGQFITLHFEQEGKTFRRSYSIANPPENNNRIEFAAGYVPDGPGTNLLFNLQVGDELQINGPFGRLILKEASPKRYVLIATSTGVTPFRAMLPELEKRMLANAELKCVIMLGVQKREDILYNKEFQHWAERLKPQLDFQAYLSRETATNLEPRENKGYVQSGFETLNLNPLEDVVYLCGNPAMIDDSFEKLKDLGFTTQNIIREKYISSK
ncbi:MAG: ferredoxin--NADP(+) reductase [Legionellales bacterium RIFCSPHIGHO2_12_FULL_35_11]|nr:MAG: ferredoxin--NADP(+) reductase [Legionellales bacterium RIFCSPHIGHO2_12_FULL_35_11]